MTPRQLIAAIAAVVSVLVLQATVLTPLTAPFAISLPAVLVATVGVEVGVSAGMSIGFSAGLLADLGSRHPAGVLALAWLLLGVGCGLLAGPRRRRLGSIAVVALTSGVAGSLALLVLALLHAPASPLRDGLVAVIPTIVGDAVLAVLVVPCARAMLRALRVQAPAPPHRTVAAVVAGATAAGVAVDG